MAYSDFTLERVENELGVTVMTVGSLFGEIGPGVPSGWLVQTLERLMPLALRVNSEKARSEFIIAPVLGEVQYQVQSSISLFSGKEFNVDAARGLTGRCDFLISRKPASYTISAPVVTIVEAKNEDMVSGLGQCIAEMVAAQIFNQKAGREIPVIFGVVTTGSSWQFLKLEGEMAYIDSTEYYIDRVDRILGILIDCIRSTLEERPPGRSSTIRERMKEER
jgi:hypothetical protein